MNFFKLYIGDYQRDTAHLSVAEHGAFLLMLQHYYATQKPLPKGKALHRMLRATEKYEREAIDSVTSQFWKDTDAGLVNERADKEIQKAEAQAEANQRTAIAREAARRKAREQHESCSDRETNDQRNHSHSHSHSESINLEDATHPCDLAVTQAAVEKLEIPNRLQCPTDAIVGLYHELMPQNPRCKVLNSSRRKAIAARWREASGLSAYPFNGGYESVADGVERWREFFAICAESKFLTGRTQPRQGQLPFIADIDFLMSPSGFAKTLEDKYHREVA